MPDWNQPTDGRMPDRSKAQARAWTPAPPAPHSYPLAVRDSGLGMAWRLLMLTLPYAFARFLAVLAVAGLCLVWLIIAPGGAWWIGNHVSPTFGFAWLIPWLLGGGWIWATIIRYSLHLIACGHVAVLTQLITEGSIGNEGESQFSFGRRVVMSRFGEVTALFGLSVLVRGVIETIHQVLDRFGEMLPIPGLSAIVNLLDMVLKAATRYFDKVVLSYSLACGDSDVWQSARDGLVYYYQNARAILKTSVWIVIAETALSALLFLALFVPAAAITAMLPAALREIEGAFMLSIAILLAAAIRSAFVKPLFLICLIVRFHVLIEGQPLNQQWVSSLSQISDKFRKMTGQRFQTTT